MRDKEAYLYHQIHPLKLATDVSAAFVSLYFFWHHELAIAILVLLVPPPIASILVTRYAHLEHLKASPFGRYYFTYMRSKVSDAVRLLGMLVMVVGAWQHSIAVIAIGLMIIPLSWLRGKLVR